jgi:hypothetical protein
VSLPCHLKVLEKGKVKVHIRTKGMERWQHCSWRCGAEAICQYHPPAGFLRRLGQFIAHFILSNIMPPLMPPNHSLPSALLQQSSSIDMNNHQDLHAQRELQAYGVYYTKSLHDSIFESRARFERKAKNRVVALAWLVRVACSLIR